MMTFDLSPFYHSTIGFDRVARLLDAASRMSEMDSGYPPYNIEAVGEDHYRVTIAVAGFAADDLDVQVQDNTLVLSGSRKDEDEDVAYLHRGIAGRAFKKQFRLADHVRVDGAWLNNGLLTVDLVRELPESMKPRRIEISRGAPVELFAKAKRLIGSGDKKAA